MICNNEFGERKMEALCGGTRALQIRYWRGHPVSHRTVLLYLDCVYDLQSNRSTQ